LEELRRKIDGLLAVGWKRVRVVTDHGWLLLPGGLPKIELSSVMVDGSIVMVGNFDVDVEQQQRIGHLFGGALSGRDTNAVNKTVSGLLKLLYPGETEISESDVEWAVRLKRF
jgi:predicted ATP-dependent Lon-type protease